MIRRFAAIAGELALGSVCAGCEGEPGLLCAECHAELHGPAGVIRSVPAGSQPAPTSGAPPAAVPVHLPVTAVAEYAGPVRDVILAHKERGRLGLARPLGDALATAVVALIEDVPGVLDEAPVALVPVPSTRSVVRQRGHDPLGRLARHSATVLRRVGYECAVVPALRHQRRVADQAGLGTEARHANLDHALTVRRSADTVLAGRLVVVVDDVITTGATLGEAARALTSAGHLPSGAAVIANTSGVLGADPTATR
jgi:predicted amidophosphoribosyltransferase